MRQQNARRLRRAASAAAGAATTALSVGLVAATAAGAATGGVSAAATSATVKLTNPTAGATVVYDGGLGNANNLRVFRENGQVAVTDNVVITPGQGCRAVSARKVLCDPTFAGRTVRTVFVQLKDLGDIASVEGAFAGQVFGDGGDDVLRAGHDDATGSSAIVYSGGVGFDNVSYSGSPVGVTVTLDGLAIDGRGSAGARDNVGDDVERVSGSEFADTLTGDERRNSLLGLGGADTINPGADVDEVFGGGAADVFLLRDGFVDVADGGSGVDRATIDRSFDAVTAVESVS
ncbi:MAG TPA: hypothetical protein VF755_10250 [Catenuloplanes sp.]